MAIAVPGRAEPARPGLRRRNGDEPSGPRAHRRAVRRAGAGGVGGRAGAPQPRPGRAGPSLLPRGRRRRHRDLHLPVDPPAAGRMGGPGADPGAQREGGPAGPPSRRRAHQRRQAALRRRRHGPVRASCPPAATRAWAGSASATWSAAFQEQAEGLLAGGVDLLLIETAQDILEVKAAIFGAREAFETPAAARVPIQAQVTLDVSGRMLLGTDIAAVLAVLESLRVDVVGLNCSTGPEHMRDSDPLPHRAHPAARLLHPQRRAAHQRWRARPLPDAAGSDGRPARGVRPRPGGQRRRWLLRDHAGSHRGPGRPRGRSRAPTAPARAAPRLASSIRAIELHQEPRPLLIGERVNAQGSRRIKELLLADDYDGIVRVARGQVEGGAHALDVCVALTERSDEADQMAAAVKALQQAVEAPLVIDSTDAAGDPARPGVLPGPRHRQLRQPGERAGPLRRGAAAGPRPRPVRHRPHHRRAGDGQDPRPASSRSPAGSGTSPAASTGWRPTSSSSTTSPSRWRRATPSGWTPRWRRSRGSV